MVRGGSFRVHADVRLRLRTRSPFDRYDVAEERDLREAAGRLATADGIFSGTVCPAAIESLFVSP